MAGGAWVTVNGELDFAALARRLRKAGDRDLGKQLNRAVTVATKPIVKDIRSEARKILPKRGGLNVYVSRMSIRTKKYSSGRRAGIVIAGSKKKTGGKVDVRRIDKGRLRHPTYGRRPWTTQSVPPGFWSTPSERGGKRARIEIQSAMRTVARQITN